MFKSATAFNQNISTWNTTNVTYMNYMFNSATAFNQNISTWDTSKVTNMDNMFKNATDFNNSGGAGDITHHMYWNVSLVSPNPPTSFATSSALTGTPTTVGNSPFSLPPSL